MKSPMMQVLIGGATAMALYYFVAQTTGGGEVKTMTIDKAKLDHAKTKIFNLVDTYHGVPYAIGAIHAVYDDGTSQDFYVCAAIFDDGAAIPEELKGANQAYTTQNYARAAVYQLIDDGLRAGKKPGPMPNAQTIDW